MPYFEWTTEIEVGHAEIDRQHKELLLLAKSVVDPLMSSTSSQLEIPQLKKLMIFTHKHFKFEEDLMRRVAYPAADQHAKYHASLLTELSVYRLKLNLGQKTNPAGFIEFLWEWLALHIRSGDRDLIAWLKSQQARAH